MGKNSYKQFTGFDKMSPETKEFLEQQGINPIYQKVYTISTDASVGDSTLTFE